MTSKELIDWKKRVTSLHYLEYELEIIHKKGEINKKERNKIKKIIDNMWLDIWKFHPDNDFSLEQAFKLNFG